MMKGSPGAPAKFPEGREMVIFTPPSWRARNSNIESMAGPELATGTGATALWTAMRNSELRAPVMARAMAKTENTRAAAAATGSGMDKLRVHRGLRAEALSRMPSYILVLTVSATCSMDLASATNADRRD
jgi:hypothetical protein